MNIVKSGAVFSRIVGIEEKLKKLSIQTKTDYLPLNRGVNMVCPLEISHIVKSMNFNSFEFQVYPPVQGWPELRQQINISFFNNIVSSDNIFITAGGMNGLSLVLQTIATDKVYLPAYYWGAYSNLLKICRKNTGFYEHIPWLHDNSEIVRNKAVIICDPNNPLGNKYPDELILGVIQNLRKQNTTVILDTPYRMLFCDNSLYEQTAEYENVILVESFSKSMGLSGQRIGFVYSANINFTREFEIRLLYNTNGIHVFAQKLVYLLLSTSEGQQAVNAFKEKSKCEIQKNLQYLKQKKLIGEELYDDSDVIGIFVAVNKSEQELLNKRIGSVSMQFFTQKYKKEAENFSRICVAISHDQFLKFFRQIDTDSL
jgi:aspartate aminotransferase